MLPGEGKKLTINSFLNEHSAGQRRVLVDNYVVNNLRGIYSEAVRISVVARIAGFRNLYFIPSSRLLVPLKWVCVPSVVTFPKPE